MSETATPTPATTATPATAAVAAGHPLYQAPEGWDGPGQAPEAAAETPETPDETATDEAQQRERDLEAAKKLRSENKSLRERLKAAEPTLKAAQEADDAKKGEAQKAAEAIQAAQKEATDEREARVRLELAIDHKIPKEGVALIGSGSFEDMERNAKVVGELFAAKQKTPPPPTDRPVEGLRPGASPESPKPADDSYPDAWKPRHLREKESRSQYGQ